jgi:hypothetical protein
MLTLLIMPLAGLHFCVGLGLDFVTPSLQSYGTSSETYFFVQIIVYTFFAVD